MKPRMMVGFCVALLFLFTIVPAATHAAVPQQINYQGYLATSGGNPVPDGDYVMSFSIYDVSTGGTPLWSEAQTVTVTKGIYNVILGQNPFPPNLFDGDLYLGVTVDTDAEMTPRQKLTSTAFALKAQKAGDADTLDGKDSMELDQAAHVGNTNNPHGVTAAQTGAASMSDITWGNLSNIPADFADGTDDTGIDTETDPTVLGSVKDGVSWGELSGIPSGFADGVDNVGLSTSSDYGRSGVSSTLYEGTTALTNKYVGKSGSHTITNGNLTVNTLFGLGSTTVTGVKGFAQSETNGYGVFGEATGSDGFGIYGKASGSFGYGVYGEATNTSYTNRGGYFTAAGVTGRGVEGNATGSYGYGVYGKSSGAYGFGVFGSATDGGSGEHYGGYFTANGQYGRGVYGEAAGASGRGVYGVASGTWGRAVYGEATGTTSTNTGGFFTASGLTGRGVAAEASGASGRGVFGWASNSGDVTNYGGYFRADGQHGRGVYAETFGGESRGVEAVNKDTGSEINYAVSGLAFGERSIGVGGQAVGTKGIGAGGSALGTEGIGVLGEADGTSGHAVRGISYTSSGYAGYFVGRGYFSGYLEKAGGGFKIDHPLEPENKYLNHSFVESPDMMNIYNGNVVLNNKGEAWVVLPDWFETLNRDFRYQLTCIGSFAQIYIAEKVSNNRFKIAGGQPNMEISWQVTGIRQDPWANANRLPVEEDKREKELGYYMHPDIYGQDEERSVEWGRRPEMMKRMKKEREKIKKMKETKEQG